MNTPEKCPFCDAAVALMPNGKPCRGADGAWVAFECLTSMFNGQDPRMCQSRSCEAAERSRLATKLAALESDNAECARKMKRFRSRWLAAHKRIMEMENEAERASERVRQLESGLPRKTPTEADRYHQARKILDDQEPKP